MNPPKKVQSPSRRDFIAGLVLIIMIMTLALLMTNLHAYRPPATFFIPAAIAIFSITVIFFIVFIETNRTDEFQD